MAFRAKFESECPECHGPVSVGQLATWDGDDVVHATHVGIVGYYKGRPEKVCPKCFLTVCDCGKDV